MTLFCQNLTVLCKDTKIICHSFVYTKTPWRDFILNLKNKFLKLEDFQFHRELSKWRNLFDKDFFFVKLKLEFYYPFKKKKTYSFDCNNISMLIPLNKKIIIFIFLDEKNHQKFVVFLTMTTLYKVWCTSKTFDDFFHKTFLVSAHTRWKEKKQTFKKSKKKYAVIQKKEDFLLFFFTPILQTS